MGGIKIKYISLLAAILSVFIGCSKSESAKHISPQAAQQSRLDWNLKTIVTAYQNIGNTDNAWDQPAIRALTEFARTRSQAIDPSEPWAQIIATNCAAAIKAGCDDPMVRYLYIKFSMNADNTPKAFSDAFDETANNMQASAYPDIRKFYVSLRAYQQFLYAYRSSNNVDFTEGYLLFNDAVSNLVGTLNDKATPPEEVYDAGSEMIDELPGDVNKFQTYYNEIQKPLFANWPDQSGPWFLKGRAYVALAWIYRGGGDENTVTKEGLKGMTQSLDTAAEALDRAWKINPADARIAVEMMNVELGQGQGRDRMELWFQRAMQDDPNDNDACDAKLNYIQPKWYGTTRDMLDFGRECVTNSNWGGAVPLVLVDAHWEIYNQYIDPGERTNYWKEPEVWNDISSAYEQYLLSYPNDSGRIAYYARYAYYAEQWKKLNELLPKVTPDNYYLFDGKEQFDEVVQLAREHAQ